MFDWVPARAWLLVLIALFAAPAALYLWRHVRAVASDSGVGAPPTGYVRGTPRGIAASITGLIAAVLLMMFIFTGQAEAFAHSPQFVPLLLLACAAYAAWHTISGFVRGEMEPLSRGTTLGPYNRARQPKRFWASTLWNASWVALMAFLVFTA